MEVVLANYMPTETSSAAESLRYSMFCRLLEIGLLINLMKVEYKKDFLNMLMD